MKNAHFFKIDDRRTMIIPGNLEETIEFMALHFISCAKNAINTKGNFFVALSGGSTPKEVYHHIAKVHTNSIDWTKVHIFFSDERSVLPNDKNSNYYSAKESTLFNLNIPQSQIHRMKAEEEIEKAALDYENLIKEIIPKCEFDLILLGVGEDGHTASLFPNTDGVKVSSRFVIKNHIPALSTDRMTFTIPLIQKAKNVVFYATGERKKEILKTVLCPNFEHYDFPATLIGNEKSPSLWILDNKAGNF